MAMSPRDRRAVALAREQFAAGVAGEPEIGPVRAEIVQSWLRCRDIYGVDPDLQMAPPASAEPGPGLDLEVVLAELSGIARAERDDLVPGVVTVVDHTGRLVAEWGGYHTKRRVADANLAPWAAWSEQTTGTNGMGTALARHGVTTVCGPEHWCRGFCELDCAGIAVRDPVTSSPLAAMNVSTCAEPLPNRVGAVLRSAAETVERTLTNRAWIDGEHLVSTFNQTNGRGSAPKAAIDVAAKVVAVNPAGARLLGTGMTAPAFDPAQRIDSDVADLADHVAQAVQRGKETSGWFGTARLSLPGSPEPIDTTIAPVFVAQHPVGALLTFYSTEGESLPAEASHRCPRNVHRILARRGERNVLLEPSEIRFAEADRNIVWLHTERGRLRAITRGLYNVEAELGDGFLRVHRRYVVNIARVREFERGFNGELMLITTPRADQPVPVSRARAKVLRHRLGI